MSEELKLFKMKHRIKNLPYLYKDNPKIGHWVINYRTEYKTINLEMKKIVMGFVRRESIILRA